MTRLHFSNRRQNKILTVIQHYHIPMPPTDRVLKRLLKTGVPVSGVLRLIRAGFAANRALTPEQQRLREEQFQKGLARAQALQDSQDLLSVTDLAISGGDIHDLVRLPRGRWLSTLQHDLLDWIREDPTRNRPEPLKERIRQWVADNPGFD